MKRQNVINKKKKKNKFVRLEQRRWSTQWPLWKSFYFATACFFCGKYLGSSVVYVTLFIKNFNECFGYYITWNSLWKWLIYQRLEFFIYSNLLYLNRFPIELIQFNQCDDNYRKSMDGMKSRWCANFSRVSLTNDILIHSTCPEEELLWKRQMTYNNYIMRTPLLYPYSFMFKCLI